MVLENFRKQDITWDKANRKVYENVRVSSEDENGRKLAVQIVNDGVVEDLTGFSLSLAWETRDKVNSGLDAFEVVDISKGQFAITYKTGMLQNVGNLNAQLVLIGTDTSKITSENFTITVFGGVGTDGAESSNEFSALTTALATVNQYDARIESKADKSTTEQSLFSLNQQLAQKVERTEAYLRSTGISLNDFNEEDRQAILEANSIDINYVLGEKNVKAINVDDNTLMPSNTSFIKGGGGINLFNGIYVTARLTGSRGYAFRNTSGGLGYIVEVEPNTDYNAYRSTDSDIFRLAIFDDYPTDGMVSVAYRETSQGTRLTISTGETGKFLVAFVASPGTNPPSEFQITKGSDAKPYISPNKKIVIDLDKKSVPPIDVEMTSFYKRSKNFFNGEYQDNKYISDIGNFIDGSAHGYPNARTTNAIECVGGESYVLSGEYNRNIWRFEDNNNVLVGTANSIQVTVPENASYMYVYYSLSGEHEKFQIEKGETPTRYSPYYVIDSEKIEDSVQNTSSNEIVLLGDNGERYNVTEPFMSEERDSSAFYQKVDDLMAEFPNIITKSLRGTTTLGTPIYQYDIQTQPTLTNPSRKIKIYLNGGTHGDERRAMYGTLRFITDLCRERKTQKSLQFFLSNVHLIYVPLLNPDGLEAGTRVNGRQVDINRNFPTDWVYNPDTSSRNYTGETPASEIETTILMDILAENPDLYFVVDYHNYTTLATANSVTWAGADDPLTQKVLRAWGQNYDGEIRTLFPLVENHETNLVSIRDRASLGTYNGGTGRYIESTGIKGFTLEAVWSFGGTTQEGQDLNADIVGNFMLSILRSYRELS